MKSTERGTVTAKLEAKPASCRWQCLSSESAHFLQDATPQPRTPTRGPPGVGTEVHTAAQNAHQGTSRGWQGHLHRGPSQPSARSPAHLWAVVMMASTTSIILCKAESVPMVMSVPQKSLSMEPTMPTTLR